ncbi:MAG: ABC transporter substrate-binding protein [Candidatus Hadarchaeales archaeon]
MDWKLPAVIVIAIALIGAGIYAATRPARPFVPGWSGPVPEERIKIGIFGPMEFSQGIHMWRGAVMAAEVINSAGGVQLGDKKVPIELVKVDTNEILSAADARAAVERAITVNKVDFCVGGFRTESVWGMLETAMDYKKIWLICGAATTELCSETVPKNYDRYKYIFRVTPINSTYLFYVSTKLLKMVVDEVRENLGVAKPKVAVLAEKLAWADRIVDLAINPYPAFKGTPYENKSLLEAYLGVEMVGAWRPSHVATDLTSELTAIKNAGAHVIFTVFSGPVGVTFGRQWGELQIPAAAVGINVEAQKRSYWEETKGYCAYEVTMTTYVPGVEIVENLTVPWVNSYIERWGDYPTYEAGTYDAIFLIAETVNRLGTKNADNVVAELEQTGRRNIMQTFRNFPDGVGTAGKLIFDNKHDVVWGPGLVTGLGAQWRDGGLVGVHPYQDTAGPLPNLPAFGTYKGTEKYRLPPRVIEYHRR